MSFSYRNEQQKKQSFPISMTNLKSNIEHNCIVPRLSDVIRFTNEC